MLVPATEFLGLETTTLPLGTVCAGDTCLFSAVAAGGNDRSYDAAGFYLHLVYSPSIGQSGQFQTMGLPPGAASAVTSGIRINAHGLVYFPWAGSLSLTGGFSLTVFRFAALLRSGSTEQRGSFRINRRVEVGASVNVEPWSSLYAVDRGNRRFTDTFGRSAWLGREPVALDTRALTLALGGFNGPALLQQIVCY